MARNAGQIIARGKRRWVIRVYLGRDHATKKRNYHNRNHQRLHPGSASPIHPHPRKTLAAMTCLPVEFKPGG